jgi:DeoR/GlpR family transcriptional regulator of sugar metabolism
MFTPSALKGEVKQAAMQAASRGVLLTTRSNYGTFGMYKVARLEQLDAIINDDRMAQAAAASIRAYGVDLMLASVDSYIKANAHPSRQLRWAVN